MKGILGTKVKKSKNTKKRSKKTPSECTTIGGNEKDAKKKTGGTHRRKDNEAENKEQPSTAANSKKSLKEKKRSKNQKKKKGDASVDHGEKQLEAENMLKAMKEKTTTPPTAVQTPPGSHPSPALIKKALDDEPKTHRPPVCVQPPPLPLKEHIEVPSIPAKGAAATKSPAPDNSLKLHSTVTPNSTLSVPDKWSGEDTAKAWLEKVDFGRTKAEFERIQMMTVNVENECKRWKANGKLNQSIDDYPALDSNLVTVENVYVNMSLMQVPLQQNIYVGQIPVKGNEEAFWKVIFDRRVTFMEIITDQELVEFFPNRSGSHVYYGTMFVNNRKVEIASEDVLRFLIEVLPEGCSNSIMCNVNVIKNWDIDGVYAKQGVTFKETLELMNFLMTAKDESAMVISKHGAGRAGYFVALTIAVFQMNKAEEPSIFEIVKALRLQRPKSVESLKQYVSLYTSLFYFIKKKMVKTDAHKRAIPNANCPITKKVIQLTQLFTAALVDEMNAAAGRSTITMIK